MHVSTHPHTLTGNQSTHTCAHRRAQNHTPTPARPHVTAHRITSRRCAAVCCPQVISPVAEKAEYQKRTTGADESQLDLITKLELTADEFRRAHTRTHARTPDRTHTHACLRTRLQRHARTHTRADHGALAEWRVCGHVQAGARPLHRPRHPIHVHTVRHRQSGRRPVPSDLLGYAALSLPLTAPSHPMSSPTPVLPHQGVHTRLALFRLCSRCTASAAARCVRTCLSRSASALTSSAPGRSCELALPCVRRPTVARKPTARIL